MPQVLFDGGPVLKYPRFMSITFPNDTMAPSLDTFTSVFGGSPEWSAMTSEYGITAATADTPVHLAESAPTTITDAQIQSWLSAKFSSSSRLLGNPDSQTIYILYYPQSTTITASGQQSCKDFDGYHSSFQDSASGVKIIYAVIARCSSYTVNDETATASHELVESATDPDMDYAGYYGVDPNYAVWNTLSYGAEVGDLCQNFPQSYFVATFPSPTNSSTTVSYEIQRSWSNKAAAAGLDPCAPAATGSIYFNAAPVLSDSVTYTDSGQQTTTRGVHIGVGQSKTIELDLFSTSKVGPWNLSAAEVGGSSDLTFSFSQSTGSNGDKVYLTIKVNSVNKTYNAEIFEIHSSLNGVTTTWPVVVGN